MKKSLISMVVTLLVVSAVAAEVQVVPRDECVFGKTYEQWSAAWWQWVLPLAIPENPLFDGKACENGANGQSGPVWFLAGVINESGTVTRHLTVPAGKYLFFPVINTESSTLEEPPFYGKTEKQLIKSAIAMFNVDRVFATLNKKPLVQNLEDYTALSPLFVFDVPEENVLGVAGPDTGCSVSLGIWLMLPPLPMGEHVLRFGGTYVNYDFSLDITYKLTVK